MIWTYQWYAGEGRDLKAKAGDNDQYVFPAYMPENLLPKLPNMVISTREFDDYRIDAEYFAERLNKHGKLLELHI